MLQIRMIERLIGGDKVCLNFLDSIIWNDGSKLQ